MFFSDIHTHLLYGVDDGPKTPKEMFDIIDKLYADGTRLVCATPHCYPEWCGDNRVGVDLAFSELKSYCAEKYPDLAVFLGNELFFGNDGMTWLKNGFCKTMNGTRYVLVEFDFGESENNITKSVQRLFNAGYVPIIAHAERFFRLSVGSIKELRDSGAVIQVNARKDFRGFDFREKSRLKKLLSLRLADIVSTDVHDLGERAPFMPEFYKTVADKYGADYAEAVFFTNAKKILSLNTAEDEK